MSTYTLTTIGILERIEPHSTTLKQVIDLFESYWSMVMSVKNFTILGLLISWIWINTTQSTKRSYSLYEDVTQSNSGCSCWFDPLEQLLSSKACACCSKDGIQCGYPMHNWCQPKVSDGHIQKGCLGKQKHYVMDQN